MTGEDYSGMREANRAEARLYRRMLRINRETEEYLVALGARVASAGEEVPPEVIAQLGVIVARRKLLTSLYDSAVDAASMRPEE